MKTIRALQTVFRTAAVAVALLITLVGGCWMLIQTAQANSPSVPADAVTNAGDILGAHPIHHRAVDLNRDRALVPPSGAGAPLSSALSPATTGEQPVTRAISHGVKPTRPRAVDVVMAAH